MAKIDPRVTKKRVTMRAITLDADGNAQPHEAVDYVLPEVLDAYVADARTRWSWVGVSDEPDAGPAGYDGPTAIPAHLDTPLAGELRAATGAKFHPLDVAHPEHPRHAAHLSSVSAVADPVTHHPED